MRVSIVSLGVVLLTGCVTPTYKIAVANDTCGNCTPPEIRARQQASEYCAKMGKTMAVKETQELDVRFGNRYTLTFTCQ